MIAQVSLSATVRRVSQRQLSTILRPFVTIASASTLPSSSIRRSFHTTKMLPIIASVVAHQMFAATGETGGSSSSSTPSAGNGGSLAGYKFVNPYANARAPNEEELAVIRSTVPVLAEHGLTLTKMFYKRMLGANPELRNIFNDAHQKTEMQPKALAAAVYAYAANIDNLVPILPAVARMAHKHCSLSVLPSQYPIVGTNLLASLEELLLSAKFPKETVDKVIAAWAVAYGQLANILITEEEKLYAAAEQQPGGWRGWKKFVVEKRENENADGSIVSLYFRPVDGGAVPKYLPGQYTTIRCLVPAKDGQPAYYQPRQYTLSKPADGNSFRVSIKREDACTTAPHPVNAGASASGCPFANKPAGVVSNLCHANLKVGSIAELACPFGDFVLEEKAPASRDAKATSPLVLIAAGVGITPTASMLESGLKAGRQVSFFYGCHNGQAQPMKSWLATKKKEAGSQLKTRLYYSQPTQGKDVLSKDYDQGGRMDFTKLDDATLQVGPHTQYFICGPTAFMKDAMHNLAARGVKSENIHAEIFNTGNIE